MSIANNRNIEAIALGLLAVSLASILTPVAVWLGVIVAYAAFLRTYDVAIVTATHRKGYTLISCNVAPGLSLCFVYRQPVAPVYNVWQLQMKGAR